MVAGGGDGWGATFMTEGANGIKKFQSVEPNLKILKLKISSL